MNNPPKRKYDLNSFYSSQQQYYPYQQQPNQYQQQFIYQQQPYQQQPIQQQQSYQQPQQYVQQPFQQSQQYVQYQQQPIYTPQQNYVTPQTQFNPYHTNPQQQTNHLPQNNVEKKINPPTSNPDLSFLSPTKKQQEHKFDSKPIQPNQPLIQFDISAKTSKDNVFNDDDFGGFVDVNQQKQAPHELSDDSSNDMFAIVMKRKKSFETGADKPKPSTLLKQEEKISKPTKPDYLDVFNSFGFEDEEKGKLESEHVVAEEKQQIVETQQPIQQPIQPSVEQQKEPKKKINYIELLKLEELQEEPLKSKTINSSTSQEYIQPNNEEKQDLIQTNEDQTKFQQYSYNFEFGDFIESKSTDLQQSNIVDSNDNAKIQSPIIDLVSFEQEKSDSVQPTLIPSSQPHHSPSQFDIDFGEFEESAPVQKTTNDTQEHITFIESNSLNDDLTQQETIDNFIVDSNKQQMVNFNEQVEEKIEEKIEDEIIEQQMNEVKHLQQDDEKKVNETGDEQYVNVIDDEKPEEKEQIISEKKKPQPVLFSIEDYYNENPIVEEVHEVEIEKSTATKEDNVSVKDTTKVENGNDNMFDFGDFIECNESSEQTLPVDDQISFTTQHTNESNNIVNMKTIENEKIESPKHFKDSTDSLIFDNITPSPTIKSEKDNTPNLISIDDDFVIEDEILEPKIETNMQNIQIISNSPVVENANETKDDINSQDNIQFDNEQKDNVNMSFETHTLTPEFNYNEKEDSNDDNGEEQSFSQTDFDDFFTTEPTNNPKEITTNNTEYNSTAATTNTKPKSQNVFEEEFGDFV
ncbi:hypothetical protein QTN25_003858 [Entamoeba marina]